MDQTLTQILSELYRVSRAFEDAKAVNARLDAENKRLREANAALIERHSGEVNSAQTAPAAVG